MVIILVGVSGSAKTTAGRLLARNLGWQFFIDSLRRAGVPFLIRAGKRMAVTATQVMVRLRAPSPPLFDATQTNHVRFRLGPLTNGNRRCAMR